MKRAGAVRQVPLTRDAALAIADALNAAAKQDEDLAARRFARLPQTVGILQKAATDRRFLATTILACFRE